MSPFELMLLGMVVVALLLWFIAIGDVRLAKGKQRLAEQGETVAFRKLNRLADELLRYAQATPNVRVSTVIKRLREVNWL